MSGTLISLSKVTYTCCVLQCSVHVFTGLQGETHTPALLQCINGRAHTHTHTHKAVLLLFWDMSGITRVSRYQIGKTRKVKTNLDLLEQEIVSGSGICWAICKSAPHPFLTPNQQRQSTEGKYLQPVKNRICKLFLRRYRKT